MFSALVTHPPLLPHLCSCLRQFNPVTCVILLCLLSAPPGLVYSEAWDPFHLIITPSTDHHAQLISTQNNKYCLHYSLQLKLKRQIVQIFRASLNNARGAAENWHSIDSWCLSRSGDVGGVYKCFLHAVLNDLMIDLPQCWWAIITEFGDIVLLNQSLNDKWLHDGSSDDYDGFKPDFIAFDRKWRKTPLT